MPLKNWSKQSNSSPDYVGDLILLGLLGAIAYNSLTTLLNRFSVLPQSVAPDAAYVLPQEIASDTEFVNKTKAIASRLQTNPAYLFAVMGFETGGTYSPRKRNLAGSGATGLIQFMPATARGMGTSTSALANLSRTQQLDYVERYLNPFKGRLNSLIDTYMAVLYPVAVGKGEDYRLFTRGTIAYRQNAGLDVNRDGVVTAGEASAKVSKFLPAKLATVPKPKYIRPSQGFVSQAFHSHHEGLDFSGELGLPILAAADGLVVKSGWDDWGLGNALEINHSDGSRTVYGHNQRLLVKVGDRVSQGQAIAEMGSTGFSTGPHLHFEVWVNGKPADPAQYLPTLPKRQR